jgi:hypothetical protein
MAEYHWSNVFMDLLAAGLAKLGKKAAFLRLVGLFAGLLVIALVSQATTARPAAAATPAVCAGAAMMGGAQLMCSLPAQAPAQLCTYSWALMTTEGQPKVVNGSFLLPPGVANMQIYQAFGFNSELSPPIVICNQKAETN